jgi:hypothetical protein
MPKCAGGWLAVERRRASGHEEVSDVKKRNQRHQIVKMSLTLMKNAK